MSDARELHALYEDGLDIGELDAVLTALTATVAPFVFAMLSGVSSVAAVVLTLAGVALCVAALRLKMTVAWNARWAASKQAETYTLLKGFRLL